MIQTWVIVETNSAFEPFVHFGGFSEAAAGKIAARIRARWTGWDHDHDCELFVKRVDGQPRRGSPDDRHPLQAGAPAY